MHTHRPRAWAAPLLLIALACAAFAGCRFARADTDLIASAVAALGGEDRIRAVKTLIVDAEGAEYQLLQNPSPSSVTDGPRWLLKPHRRAFDLVNHRMRLQRTISVTFPWVLDRVRRQDVGIDADGLYNVGTDGVASRSAAPAAGSDVGQDRYHHPLTILAAALERGTTLSNPRSIEGHPAVDITVPSGETVTLAVDGATKLPAFVLSKRDQPNLGNVEFRTSFSDYEDMNGLKLPRRLITRLDRYVVNELVVRTNTINADPDGFLIDPARVAAAKPAPDPRLGPLTPVELAPGLWFFYGGCIVGCDNSIAVEFSDHLELIEVPIGDARTLNVIAATRKLRPEKPLTKAIVTHHHSDHAGGLRAAISEGLTIVAHESAKLLFEELARRPHTIRPDALAKQPMPLRIETVGDQQVVNDPLRRMEIYHVDGDPHADSMIMMYFPKEQFLVEGDPYNPSNPAHVWAPNLLNNIERLKLKVVKLVPIHGEPVSHDEFMKAVASGGAALAHWY